MGVKKNGNILLHIPYNAMPYASVLFFFNLTFSNRKKSIERQVLSNWKTQVLVIVITVIIMVIISHYYAEK